MTCDVEKGKKKKRERERERPRPRPRPRVLLTPNQIVVLLGCNIEPIDGRQNLRSKLTNQKTTQFAVRSAEGPHVQVVNSENDDDIAILAAVATYMKHDLHRNQSFYENILPRYAKF